ncbi:TetR/AcrR family transcriptional regulator [Rhodoferax sp.]|uniref:TetR/AcrR family transcriptional regulator n=1 Tax=Rhodoferax sp. TaxID=50421 RepID=UPI00374CCE0F
MPRVSKAQTDSNRVAIEEASSRLFREQGVKNVSVADLMAEVGLTHGGFYGHFESKDALAAVACTVAFKQAAARWHQRVGGHSSRTAALNALFEGYLSAQSRNSVGSGCPLAALATDVAREPVDKPIHNAYLDGVNSLLNVLLPLQNTGNADTDRSQSLVQLSTVVGAMVLARATQGDAISDELLAAARAHLVAATSTPFQS